MKEFITAIRQTRPEMRPPEFQWENQPTTSRRRVRSRAQRSRMPRNRPRSRRGRAGRGGGRIRTNRADEIAAAVTSRTEVLQTRVSELSEESLRNLVLKICQKNPSFVFDLLEESTRQSGGYHPEPDGESPSWCICTLCREMPTETEKLCCKQNPANCFSRVPDFNLLVLDEGVLAISKRYRQDVLAVPEDHDLNRGFRHAAYRQFILWHHGRLGAGNRRVIPSCCVWRIRDKFPDPFRQYTGFKDGRLA